MRKFYGHSPPFITFLNIKNVTGRMLIVDYLAMGGLPIEYTDSG
jgi:hypothetical protein